MLSRSTSQFADLFSAINVQVTHTHIGIPDRCSCSTHCISVEYRVRAGVGECVFFEISSVVNTFKIPCFLVPLRSLHSHHTLSLQYENAPLNSNYYYLMCVCVCVCACHKDNAGIPLIVQIIIYQFS